MAQVLPIRPDEDEDPKPAFVHPETEEPQQPVPPEETTLSRWRVLCAWLSRRWFLWRVARATIDQNEKCPNCGWRLGRIEWNYQLKKNVHQCLRCRAKWTSDPMLASAEWVP
jgi:hypothetical protein